MIIKEITDDPLSTKPTSLSKEAELQEIMTILSEETLYGLYQDAMDAHERFQQNPNPASKFRLSEKLKAAKVQLRRIVLTLNVNIQTKGVRELMTKINGRIAEIDELLEKYYLEEKNDY